MMMLYYVLGISASSSSEFMNITHVNIQLSILSSILNTRERSASRPALSIMRFRPGHSFSLLSQAGTPFSDHFQSGTKKSGVPDAHGQHQTTAPPLQSEAQRGTHQSAKLVWENSACTISYIAMVCLCTGREMEEKEYLVVSYSCCLMPA